MVNASIVASKLGLIALAMTGSSPILLAAFCVVSIQVPAAVTTEVQEYYFPIYHALCAMLESKFFQHIFYKTILIHLISTENTSM